MALDNPLLLALALPAYVAAWWLALRALFGNGGWFMAVPVAVAAFGMPLLIGQMAVGVGPVLATRLVYGWAALPFVVDACWLAAWLFRRRRPPEEPWKVELP